MPTPETNLDYATLVAASRHLDLSHTTQTVKLALLSDAATQRLVPLLRTLFARQGVNAEIYEAPFDAIELEVYNLNSALYQFQPQAVVVLNAVQALRADFLRTETNPNTYADKTTDRITRIWNAIQANHPATILQSNYALPYERFFGNFDQKVPHSLYTTVASLNTRIAEQARLHASVLICDIESIASWQGRKTWFEDRFWDSAKYFCALDCLPYVANNIVDIVMASLGRGIKCVVTDLDNTLWGGIIGDDGIDGIQISAHGEGEAFHRMQLYLRGLKERGIVLAVCSKNEMANAVLPFEKHPEMVLRREDFAVFIANWNDKAINIRQIKETLNIGYDSIVFLDDNPFERNVVRELVPGVVVPELPEDPADYVRAISELNLFETTSFSAEDAKRTELYQAEATRREEQAGFASLDEFLQSLDMRITVSRFAPFHLPRISQLMQRSNQFNLTTRRLSEIECRALMENETYLPLYAKLSDRLSDHGLISIVTVEAQPESLAIRDWLMSCRVLGRGVENFLMNQVVEHAKNLHLPTITAEYVPTAKNGMVKDFYHQFGFTKTNETETGHSQWHLTTTTYTPRPTFMKTTEKTVEQ
jgi:FkbH-like protein